MKKKKNAEESFTRDFPKGKSLTENKEENAEYDDDDKPVIDSFHVSNENSNKVHTVDDSDDDMGDVKVELIEEDDEEIEEIVSKIMKELEKQIFFSERSRYLLYRSI